ncbi:Biotin synthase [Seminavis robusta]|uniref:biotin synthase n=1 Tax=Seminavis robusta TaxID=568900 RepID=A0A9N8EQ92_9STRA|nr:Biotin synthase [Seminavis robusta]|eukprot:Sro1425_g271630.1 Biotin synthase (438) ;mRNA; r:26421-27734
MFARSTCSRLVLRGVLNNGRNNNKLATRTLSMAPQASSQGVVLDKYIAQPTPTTTQQQQQRLPNDVHDRNDLYEAEEERSMAGVTASVRHDWTKEEIAEIFSLPFHELMYRSATVHRMYWDPSEVQQCTLLSIKTGGCTEDCSYCSQSTRHKTFVKPTPTMKVQEVLEAAARAKEAGSTRFCMGAAWRELGNKKNAFNHILEMVRGVNGMGLEVCCTLGMLNAEQARQLKEAGLSAYNHNLDTSPEHYPNVITTRSYQDRLDTIANVRDAGISVCCGGILGLGEEESDRVGLLHVLATLPEHPESVPINALVAVEGTPLGESGDIDRVDAFDMARVIATARIVMPRTMVRLSAGRLSFSDAEQYLMFQAGANSIFNGDKLLTTSNPEFDEDQALFAKLGFSGKPAHKGPLVAPAEAQGEVEITHVSGSSEQRAPQFA